MSRTILQSVDFDNVTPAVLFQLYMDPGQHERAIGAPVTMSPTVGGRFTAFGEGHVSGTNLMVVADRMVVQSWRARVWRNSDPDSILILQFSRAPAGATIDLIQAGVPEHAWEIIDRGWHSSYWRPWTTYLNQGRKAS